jgi:hypothetical protein
MNKPFYIQNLCYTSFVPIKRAAQENSQFGVNFRGSIYMQAPETLRTHD